jgi:hypothetical protein
MTFYDIASEMASRGVPQIRIRPGSKIALDNNWPELATTNLDVLKRWSEENPDANSASVARNSLDGYWFFEVDSSNVIERIKAETGQQIKDAVMVRSRPGRGHYYFKQTPASIAMGNISQGFVKYNDWSARVNNQYVVSPKSVHPLTNQPYELLTDCEISEAPEWLIAWLLSQKTDKRTTEFERKPDGWIFEPIVHGGIHDRLVAIAGYYIEKKNIDSPDVMYVLLKNHCEKQAVEPDFKTPFICDLEKVRAIAENTVKSWKTGEQKKLVFAGPQLHGTVQSSGIAQTDAIERPVFEKRPFPRFPLEILYGTSIYENFVKPICDVNSRIPWFMHYPAMLIMLNYLTNKVSITGKEFRGNLFSVIIGKTGSLKSSSVDDAIKYMREVGIIEYASMDRSMSAGKAMVWTAGSPEGLGIDMQRTSCKNALLYYDELENLISKASIDASALRSALLTTYESKYWANTIKSHKDKFAHEPGTYAMSLITCTTDDAFQPLWGKLSGATTGLNGRFAFIYQPEVVPTPTPYKVINTSINAINTKKVLDKALAMGVYSIFDESPLYILSETRDQSRAEKYALYFAVDEGKDEIDEISLEKAIALVRYENEVKQYVQTYEAETKEGSHQQRMFGILEGAGGEMTKNELERQVHPERMGLSVWKKVYKSAMEEGWIRQVGNGVKGDPYKIQLLRRPNEKDKEGQ